MASTGMLCCNPINVDDDIDDMELEDVWELQRSRSQSKSTKQTNSKNKNKNKNKTKGNKSGGREKNDNRQTIALKRVKSTGKKKKAHAIRGRSSSAVRSRPPPIAVARVHPRSASTGRKGSGWGLPSLSSEKKVSISNYVEKIDYPPEELIAGRGKPVRPPPMVRRTRSKSTGDRSRNTGEKKKKRFGWGKKKREQLEEDYHSASDSDSYDSYEERPNFFSMM